MACFIHAADIHLGAPLAGLAHRSKGAAEAMRDAGRRAFDRLIDATLEHGAAFLVVAGDLFDRGDADLRLQAAAADAFERLTARGVGVFLLAGNHDATSQAAARALWPEGVRVFGSAAPDRFEVPALGVALTGQSFGARAEARDLAAGYPAPPPGRLNIGVLHTSADGRAGHGVYAPCAPADLAARGYDYWALGHVHTREILNDRPWIAFSGCLQGRSIHETGAKGALRVDFSDGRVDGVDFLALDAARWVEARLDLGAVAHEDALRRALRGALEDAAHGAEGRPAAVRLTLEGDGALGPALRGAHGAAEWREVADLEAEALSARRLAAGLSPVFVERLKVAPPPEDAGAPLALDDVFAACIAEAVADPALRQEIRAALSEMDLKAGDLSLFADGEAATDHALAAALALIRAEVAALDAGLEPAGVEPNDAA